MAAAVAGRKMSIGVQSMFAGGTHSSSHPRITGSTESKDEIQHKQNTENLTRNAEAISTCFQAALYSQSSCRSSEVPLDGDVGGTEYHTASHPALERYHVMW